MAVRPLVTTGAALLSAGALVAATPALFIPRDQITIAAPTAAPGPTQLTREQIDLLAFSLQGAWQSFTQGYGGYHFKGQSPKPAEAFEGTGDNAGFLVDRNDTPLFLETGVRATTADLEPGAQYYNSQGGPVFELDQDGQIVLEDDPGNCAATGAVCQKGFTGLAYYVSDNLLPLGDVDNIFFEGGFTELAHVAIRTVAMAIDAVDPTGRLDLTRRVDDFFEGGVTQLVGNLLLDNLPQDGYAYGLTNSFFFGYGTNTGIYAAFTYVVDAIAQGTPTPDPNFLNPLGPAQDQVQPFDSGPENTLMLAKRATTTQSTATSTGLPNFSNLVSLPTPKLDVESPWKKLTDNLPPPVEPKLVNEVQVQVQDQSALEENAEGTSVVDEPAAPEVPKVETPKLPTPELNLPKLNLDLKPKPEVKEAADPEETKGSEHEPKNSGAVDTKTGNKVAPPIIFGDGRPKGETNGSKFLKKLDTAVKNFTGAGKDEGTDAGKDKGADGGKGDGDK